MDPADAKYPNDTRNNLAVVSLFQPNGYMACIKKSISIHKSFIWLVYTGL